MVESLIAESRKRLSQSVASSAASALPAFLCDEARDRGQVLPVTFTKDVEAMRY